MKCAIIQDLLPLYCDSICSEASRELVEEHVAQCGGCRDKLAAMMEDAAPGAASLPAEEEQARVLRGVRKHFSLQRWLSVLVTAAVMLVISFTVLAAADVEQPVAYTDGLVTVSLAADEVLDLYYHGDYYAAFYGFSREVDGRSAVFLCFTQTIRSALLPLPGDGDGHLCIGNALFTDFETACYQVDRNIDAVYYLIGDYAQLPAMPQPLFEQTMEEAVLLWECTD